MPKLVLGLLIAAACAFNLTKPVHVDDTAYLRMAGHIAQEPMRPMSFVLNWGDGARLAFEEMNQPPLFFYALALSYKLFGSFELGGHMTLAVATALAVLLFFGVARRVAPQHALLATAVFTLGPAFLPAQNIMTDVPLLACWLATAYFLLRAGEAGDSNRNYAIAGVAAAAACLIKYTSLGLLGAFAAVLIGRRHWRSFWALAIPIAGLAAWSIWTYELYGRSHLLARSTSFDALAIGAKSIDWMTGLGLAAPWAFLSLAQRPMRRWAALAGAFAAIVGIAMFAVMRVYGLGDLQAALLTALLVGNGAVAIVSAMSGFSGGRADAGGRHRDETLVLASWLAGAAGIAIVLAPFMAVRHVLPALPPLVLLVMRAHGDWFLRKTVVAAALMLTIVPGVAVAVADFEWASVYPEYAAGLAETYPSPPGSAIAVGHWGWQWYASKQGWQAYDRARTTLRAGDFVFEPVKVTGPRFSNEHARQLARIAEVPVPSTPLTILRTAPLYSYSWRMGMAPIAFSRSPIETFNVYQVMR